ncbi:hypothetical protein, partial [Enterococcus faecium]
NRRQSNQIFNHFHLSTSLLYIQYMGQLKKFHPSQVGDFSPTLEARIECFFSKNDRYLILLTCG